MFLLKLRVSIFKITRKMYLKSKNVNLCPKIPGLKIWGVTGCVWGEKHTHGGRDKLKRTGNTALRRKDSRRHDDDQTICDFCQFFKNETGVQICNKYVFFLARQILVLSIATELYCTFCTM